MASEREQFLAIVQRHDVISSRLPQALTTAGIAPGLARWRSFIDNLLLWLGASAIAAGTVFFVAYNWDAMGRFTKFALVQAPMIGAICSYVWFRQHERLAKASLFVACLLVGVLLALYGQTYQTGADPWELFACWALMILPWTFIARFAPLWLLFVGLINLALILYSQTFGPYVPWFEHPEMTLALGLAVFNFIALAVWEWRMPVHGWMQDYWSPRLLFIGAGAPATLLAIDAVMSAFGIADLTVILIWALFTALLVYFYRYRRPDLFMLAGVCFAIISVVIAWLIEHVVNHLAGSSGEYLFMAVAIIAMGATAAFWLRKTQRAMFEERQ